MKFSSSYKEISLLFLSNKRPLGLHQFLWVFSNICTLNAAIKQSAHINVSETHLWGRV